MRFAPVLVSFLAHQLAGVSYAAEYTITPELVDSWTGPSPIGDGNAVRLMPSGRIVATNSDGTMTVVGGGEDGEEDMTFTPKPMTDDSVVSCKSGASVYTGADGTEFGVYAVTDTPGNPHTYTSRVIAVNLSTMEEEWSQTVYGLSAGTPLIGSDNEHVYINHNLDGLGHFTVLGISSGGDFVFESRENTNFEPLPYAPLGMAKKPSPWANYAVGFRNTNDFLCWAGQPMGAITGQVAGKTWGFQLPRAGTDTAPAVTQLQEVGWVGTTAPVFSSDGQEMFYSVSAGNRKGAQTRAWIGGKNFGTGASYKGTTYAKDGVDAAYASGALSPDESMFYYPSTAAAFYGTSKTDGAVVWEDAALPGVVRVKPVPSPDGKAVFFITEDGTVYGKDAKTGENLFTPFKNGNIPKATADFSVSDDGTMLYYGITESLDSAVYYQVRVGAPQGPTVSPTPKPPTVTPPSDPPTAEPTVRTTQGPTLSPQPTSAPTTAAPTVTMSPTVSAETEEPTPSPVAAETEEPTPSPVAATSAPPVATPSPPTASVPSPTETGTEEPAPTDPPSAGSFVGGSRFVLVGGTSCLLASLFLL